MTPKLLKFIILMTIIVVLIWIAGEIVIIAFLGLSGVASIVWSIAMIIAAISISLYKSLGNDKNKNDRNW